MDDALQVYSSHGILKNVIKATDIKSRADARKLGPFADTEKTKKLSWVNWGHTKKTDRWIRPYFRSYPKNVNRVHTALDDVRSEIEQREFAKNESFKHRAVKDSLAECLRNMLKERRSAKWAFVDERISSFPLSGDLLSDVIDIQTEFPIQTPFGKDYRFDIALLGPKIRNNNIMLGAIEIEFNHEFEMLKCLVSKASGFPIVSLDITDIAEDDISDQLCKTLLLETTTNSVDDRRRNYIYIHDTLYPVYMDIPLQIDKKRRHQYVIFVRDGQYDQLLELLTLLRRSLGITGNEVLIQPVPCRNEQMQIMLRNEGSIAGHDWANYNNSRYIRVTLDKPSAKSGPVYQFHLAMARLINSHFETLVGYKYRPGYPNDDPDDPLWRAAVKDEEGGKFRRVPILPKHVSEPLGSIMAVLDSLA